MSYVEPPLPKSYLFVEDDQTTVGGQGSLAKIYRPPAGFANVNIVKDYRWTLSNAVRETAPKVILREYQVNETQIKRQAAFYLSGVGSMASNVISGFSEAAYAQSTRDPSILDVYKALYPKDRETGFVYHMPYFSDINFEVNTPMWASLDTLEAVKTVASGIATLAKGQAAGTLTGKAIDFLGAGAMAGLATAYPKIGITDRPRLWNSHEPRSIEIKFPLFNTYSPDDWFKNRELCELLVNQNLYNKRDFITSIPPVFYEVLVPGQHYSYASCVTNLTIYNRGNMRIVSYNGRSYNVPDVYEINLTLTDMVMPSKNMFQSINDNTVETVLVDPNRTFKGGATDLGKDDLKKLTDKLISHTTGQIKNGISTITEKVATFGSDLFKR